MKTKIINKAISAILIFVLTFSYWGVLVGEVYAEYEELEKQKVQTNHKSVEFDTYFKENNENTHTITYSKSQIGKLYVNLSTKEGYLKQIRVKLDNPNFSMLKEDIPQAEESKTNSDNNAEGIENIENTENSENTGNSEEQIEVQSDSNSDSVEAVPTVEEFENEEVEIADNEIIIDIIEKQEEIELPVIFKNQELISADYFSKETKVELKAILVDNKGKEKEIEAERKILVEWNEEVSVDTEQQVEKVINLGENRYLLQTNLKTRIRDNSVPVENTKIEILNPVIESTSIERVDMYAISTTMSNGITDNLGFTQENWQYNNEEGKIFVNIDNKRNDENKIVWKSGDNEFKLIYIINSNEAIESKDIKLGVIGAITYNGREVSFENTTDGKVELSGKLIDIETLITPEENKGYMYSKTQETEYATRVGVEISYHELIDYVDIDMKKDSFINSRENRLNTDCMVFKRTEMNKANFTTIFGEEGRLEVYGNGVKIADITKDTETNEEGNIVINYPESIVQVRIVTTKPVAEGKLELANLKAIKAETGYSRERIMDLIATDTEVTVTTNMTNETKSARMNLQETVTKAELTMLTDKISTVIKNENVEIKVLFRTDSNKYDLYRNPYIEIELPVEIQNLEIENIAAAFGDGFSLNWYDVVETDEGNKVIRIALNGEQTGYAVDISEGMSIILSTKMTLDKKSGSKEGIVKLRYRNENAIRYDDNGETEGVVQIEAPTGVVAINSISNYNNEGNTAVSLSSKEQMGNLQVFTEKKTAKIGIDVVNNYESEIENPSILGRLPVEGNKRVDGGELANTFTAAMVKGIEKTEGLDGIDYKIYYSENPEANEDITNVGNGWIENLNELREAKSYLIVAEGYKMEKGDSMSFEYEVEIPEGLEYDSSTYSSYAIDYTVKEDGAVRDERTIAPTVGATTGKGPKLEASIEADVPDNSEVEEGEVITYTVKVKNVGDVEAKNIVIKTPVLYKDDIVIYDFGNPRGSIEYIEDENDIPENVDEQEDDEYIEDKTDDPNVNYKSELVLTKDAIPAGETFEATFLIRIKSYNEEQNKLDVFATVDAEDLGKQIQTNTYINRIKKGSIKINLTSQLDEEYVYGIANTITMRSTIENVTSEEKNNVVYTYKIPEGLDYVSSTVSNADNKEVQYNEKSRTLTIKIGNMYQSQKIGITVVVKVAELGGDTYEKEFINSVSIKSDEMATEKVSNEVKLVAAKPKLVVSQTSNRDYNLNAGEEIEYYIQIENQGKTSATDVRLIDVLPEELQYNSLSYEIDGQKGSSKGYINENNHYEIMFDIPALSEVLVTLNAKAMKQSEKEVEIVNAGDLINQEQTLEVNALTHKILSDDSVVAPDGNVVKVYNISGIAWNDENKNGKRDSGEAGLSNIEVILIDSSTGNIAKKASSNQEQKVTTNSNGEYRFTEVKEGKYVVAFLYNDAQYSITERKKSGVSENENSDAIKTEVKINGKTQLAGVTETIEVNKGSLTGINIGLIQMNSAVFSLNKVVTKMSMANPKTSKTVSFKNSKLAKMDSDWKYMSSTNFVIEYKLQVTNEGSVPGYVKKIVDRLPSEFKFNADSNRNWYSGNNGEVYNTSLSNTIINPGETKEVTLVVTKKMTESGDGIFHNTAEIAEVYNEYGLENVIRKDQTKQSADVMIGVKTGGAVYVSLVFVILGLMGIGLYFINKRMQKKNDDDIVKIDNIEI